MKLFLDTANVDEIRQGAALGVIDGVTTNPSLVAKEKRSVEDVAMEICEIVDGPVSLEVVATEAGRMVEEGRHLSQIHPNIVVKLPMNREGLRALRVLSEEEVQVNVTLVFSAGQALLAAKNGAAMISPFVGRLDDIGNDGLKLVSDILMIYENYNFSTEILVASVRNPMHVVDAAKIGADIVTLPYKVLEQLLKHPLTDAGLERFLSDWRKQNEMVPN